MPNTYTQINIHAVFAVKGRQNFLITGIHDELFKYISGILRSEKQYALAVNGMNDHIHIFFEQHPDTKVSDTLQKIKANSARWINERGFLIGKFEWQSGYAAFSYSRSQRDDVIKYISNQKEHHHKKSFREEYLEMLKKHEIKYDDKYVFEFYE